MTTNGHTPTHDPLHLLRDSISKSLQPIPTSSDDASLASDTAPLESAKYLLFNTQSPESDEAHTSILLSTPTRFISARENKPLDLLSVFFSWTNRDTSLTEYIAAVQALNAARTSNGLAGVANVPFTERVDLASWLSGETDESEFIKRADEKEAKAAADRDAAIAKGDGDTLMTDADTSLQPSLKEDERMKTIYRNERVLGDRNTCLRGIKPTDFSHVRKLAAPLLRSSSRPNGPTPAPVVPAAAAQKQKQRRPEPIILLSPSASSLLRLSNIKTFLQDGIYTPPSSSSTGANILHITRTLPSIEPNRPLRFILVETPENFKPDYWGRVVAVFTTGQSWQFKGYKWQQPAELFSHALGVYVGWKGEGVPDSVKGWGRGVVGLGLDKFVMGQTEGQRWRDREVVEEIWSAVEGGMRARGWGKETR